MNILIVDDHPIVRKGLKTILLKEFYFAEIFQAGDGICALDIIKERTFDLILLDIAMPFMDGIDVLKQMRAENVRAPILMVSMHPENPYAKRSLLAGASGYISKESIPEEFLIAIHKVLSGHKYVSDHVAEGLAESLYNKNHTSHDLSNREIEVLEMMSQGKTISEVAKEKHLSVNTISTYRARILEKLHLRTTAEIIRYAWDCKKELNKNIGLRAQVLTCRIQ